MKAQGGARPDDRDMKTSIPMSTALHQGATLLQELPTARRDAELLLLRAVGRDRAWLFAHPEATLESEQARLYQEWLVRRSRHEPVQYIVGEQEFYGLKVRVTPEVLIPRPETEHLVEALLRRVPRTALRVADVGTGSGAIAIAVAHGLPQAQVTALERSTAALAVAQENAERHGVAERIRFLKSDLLAAVRGESFDAIVSNPPYVADNEILEAQVRLYEPREALYAGPTGLEVYRRLIPEARQALVPGGWLMLEMGKGQRDAVAELLAPRTDGNGCATEWDEVEFAEDLQGIPRVATARRSA